MTLKPLALWAAGLLAALLVAGAGYFSLRATDRPAAAQHSLRPDDPQVLRIGERIYAQQCAACHGAKGEGQADWREPGADGLLPAPPHDPSGHTWHHPDEQLFAITKQGLAQLINQPDYRTAMPIYGGVLSDDEIVAVLSWIKAQWPPEIRQRHDEINVQYRKSLSR
ncbi:MULTISPECIES: c-type cytochrome [Diaphorobacter]|uniref:Cytochrome c class I n=1 Tax=Acidovorax ebreus (strain TPSY) TaxID=535289 RepID=A0A9J9Q808_ACIET|nr:MULTISPECIES: cytochrome c [Diaphorobacter]ACM33632.1 cytochrome c class I [[Acidovorax] ebreus TPSY]